MIQNIYKGHKSQKRHSALDCVSFFSSKFPPLSLETSLRGKLIFSDIGWVNSQRLQLWVHAYCLNVVHSQGSQRSWPKSTNRRLRSWLFRFRWLFIRSRRSLSPLINHSLHLWPWFASRLRILATRTPLSCYPTKLPDIIRDVNKASGVKAKAKNANVNCQEIAIVNLSILSHFRYSLEKLQWNNNGDDGSCLMKTQYEEH